MYTNVILVVNIYVCHVNIKECKLMRGLCFDKNGYLYVTVVHKVCMYIMIVMVNISLRLVLINLA